MAKKNNRMSSLLEKLNKTGLPAEFLTKESLSSDTSFIDTGCYALNAIMSGSLFGGVPASRITGFAGPSGCGKTLMCLRIAANAQKKGYHVFYVDSENALDYDSARRLGCKLDPEWFVHQPVLTVEEAQYKCSAILNNYIEVNKEIKESNKGKEKEDWEPEEKCMIIIDSLGNLNTEKEIRNSFENGVSGDMGMRAKSLGLFLRVLTGLSSAANAPILFTNHVYDNPGSLYPTLVKSQSGGAKVTYIASTLVQMSAVLAKTKDNEDAEKSELSQRSVGRKLHMLTTKNRFVISELECDIDLNYKTGLDKYSGLLDVARAVGYITNQGPTYFMGETRLGYAKTFDNPEFWDAHLNELDAIVKRETALSEDPEDITDETSE